MSKARWPISLLLLATASGANADCPIDRPIQVGFFEVGINFDQKTNAGSDLDVMEELARRTGCRFNYSYDSRVRIWKQIEDGSLDMTASAIDTPEREKLVRFVIVHWDRNVLLGHPGPELPSSAEAFLADHSLLAGTVKSYRYSPGVDEWINALRAQNRTYEAPDLSTLLKVFDAGRVAVVPIGSQAYSQIGKRYELTRPVRRLDWFAGQPKAAGGLALSRARLPEAVATRFGEEIEKMRQDRSLLHIDEKYSSPELAAELLSPR